MRLEVGLEHEFVEALLLDLYVFFGLGHHCRRAAGLPDLRGSAGGSSELLSMLLLLCDQAAVPLDGPLARARVHLLRVACRVLAVEEAGHVDSF